MQTKIFLTIRSLYVFPQVFDLHLDTKKIFLLRTKNCTPRKARTNETLTCWSKE